MISNPEELQAAWQEWVEANLGRDGTRSREAAQAAAEASLQGAGFEGAAQVARDAWRSASRTIRDLPTSAMPLSLVAAMIIAIGGGVVSAVSTIWVDSLFGTCDQGICSFVSSVAAMFIAFNLAVAAVNWLLLYKMQRRSRAAWVTTVVLVSLGALADILGQFVPGIPTWYVNLGAFFLALYLNLPDFWLHASGWWLLVHLFTIQLPILLALVAARRWFRAGAPAVAVPSGNGGIPDAAF